MAKAKRWDPTPEQVRQAIFLHGADPKNFPVAQLAAFFEVSVSTFTRAVKKNAALREGLRGAKAKMLGKVVQTAYQLAVGDEKKNIPANPRMNEFYLKCQGKWGYEQRSTVNHRGLLNENNAEDVNEAAVKAVEHFKGLLDEFRRIPPPEFEQPAGGGAAVPESGAGSIPEGQDGSE